MPSRRKFLAGMLASGLAPGAGWATAGNPAYLSAARLPSGAYALVGLSGDGAPLFRVPLPGRGHAAAAHPRRALAVAFARRPGRFAIVIDCVTGRTMARMETPVGHHFSGHGTFSADGTRLFTSENDFEKGAGAIGVWDVGAGFRRIGAFPSGGIGPHDITLMPDGETLVVANGGIETHPETGRSKLNLPSMRPNLSYLSLAGRLQERHEPPVGWRRNSIRHLAVRADGLVAMGCQWQGDHSGAPPLLATHRRGGVLRFHPGPEGMEREMRGYVGSVAFSGDGTGVALTGPRGNMAPIFSDTGRYLGAVRSADICGAASRPSGFCFTTGHGEILHAAPGRADTQAAKQALNWDNHLIRVATAGG